MKVYAGERPVYEANSQSNTLPPMQRTRLIADDLKKFGTSYMRGREGNGGYGIMESSEAILLMQKLCHQVIKCMAH